ncbi:MAG: hypothetical protein D6756_13230 [Cyanobacteria bacterium J083]|nr:MAG: hypothetical protein D6756_13230 [Cyanobacteria bacterium J083]
MYITKLTPLILATTVALAGCTIEKSDNVLPNKTPQSNNNPTPPPTNVDNSQTNNGKVLVSSDGKNQINLPQGWSENKTLNQVANIQAADVSRELYTIVISDPKAEVPNLNLQSHSQTTQKNVLNALKNPTVTPTKVNTVNGNPAIQYQIRGVHAQIGIPVIYLHTTVETPNNFHQIVSWSTPSSFAANEQELQNMIQSFKEVSNSASL